MKTGDLVLITSPTRNDYGLFVEQLGFDRMVSVEILKETVGSSIKPADSKGVKLLTNQRNIKVIFTADELKKLGSK